MSSGNTSAGIAISSPPNSRDVASTTNAITAVDVALTDLDEDSQPPHLDISSKSSPHYHHHHGNRFLTANTAAPPAVLRTKTNVGALVGLASASHDSNASYGSIEGWDGSNEDDMSHRKTHHYLTVDGSISSSNTSPSAVSLSSLAGFATPQMTRNRQ